MRGDFDIKSDIKTYAVDGDMDITKNQTLIIEILLDIRALLLLLKEKMK